MLEIHIPRLPSAVNRLSHRPPPGSISVHGWLAALLLGFASLLLCLEAASLCTAAWLGGTALFRAMQPGQQPLLHPFTSYATVLPLGALILHLNRDHISQPFAELRQILRSKRLALAQVELQDHFRARAVGVLPARAARRGVAPLQLMAGDHDAGAYFQVTVHELTVARKSAGSALHCPQCELRCWSSGSRIQLGCRMFASSSRA